MDNNNLYEKDNQNQSGDQGQFQQQPYQSQQPYQPYQPQQPYQQQPYQQQSYQGNTDLEEPVTFADWMISTLIMCIPCVGIIMIFVWAFGSNTKKSKSNYFKAMLVWTAIGFVLAIVMGGAFAAILASIADTGLYY